ncbi:MAG: dihydrofolate reductase family protein [Candidatus Iainarchaeum archaeon]|uniref:Dihydrofolate reductase family protein n=1 Tax=Candidatus Iainarchaeum sp. TaxID=3101447 RepID=A0A7T9DKM4_9ARCH|nr:MAG: dihydrofolate reductase family protein [Candidatus Diapherotrites archaeon]
MEENLIDEYYLSVNPVLLGKGKPLFKDTVKRTTLELVKTKYFPQGVVLLHYKK